MMLSCNTSSSDVTLLRTLMVRHQAGSNLTCALFVVSLSLSFQHQDCMKSYRRTEESSYKKYNHLNVFECLDAAKAMHGNFALMRPHERWCMLGSLLCCDLMNAGAC